VESWYVTDPNVIDYYTVHAERYTALLTLRWDILPSLNLLAGTEDYYEDAVLEQPPPAGATPNYFGNQLGENLNSVSYYNLAGFAELQWRSVIGSLTAGARYEYNQEYGDSFVPRAALTKTLGRFHFKLLYSFAFRAPGIEDINYSAPPPAPPIQPERTQDAEVEVGYQFTDHLSASANFFYIEIKDPIVYSASSNGAAQVYQNFPQTGTEGIEAEFRLKYRWGYLNTNYSYYTAWSIFDDFFKGASMNEVSLYAVPNDPSLLAGFPAHKVSLNGHFVIWKGLSLNPSGSFLSRRYGQWSGDGDGNGIGNLGPALYLLNFYVMYKDLGVKGLDLGAGVYDLLNETYTYLQPYQSGHAPLPGPSREILARLAYALPF
jgi:outer membrane receptor for ferrienterochelin and colicin